MRLYHAKRVKADDWRKSSFCAQTECAEITRDNGDVLLRSSLSPRVVVRYTPEEFRALRLGIKAGEFDDL
jgi:Domain of unknown function (DUF397)